MGVSLAWIAFTFGALVCLVNFYLSFLRYPLHRLRGNSKDSFHWVSGFPLVGSLFVALSLLGLHNISGITLMAVILIVIDTGGIHWFIGSMIYQSIQARKRD
jgi:uncharacterized membrane protein YdcZ (DUF606 family)